MCFKYIIPYVLYCYISQVENAAFLKNRVISNIMKRKSNKKLYPINLGDETLGHRIARLRKERGYTQAELSEKIGIIRELISDYERGRLRPNYEMIIRFALIFEVSSDELLGIKTPKRNPHTPSLKILRRLKKIEALPQSHQKFVLKAIDSHLKALEK